MLPYIIGGVALAATGYGVKKFLAQDENYQKLEDSLIKGYDWLDEAEKKAETVFEEVDQKLEEFFTAKEEQKGRSFFLDLSDEEEHHPDLQECILRYETASYELYRFSFMELQKALNEMKNAPREIDMPSFVSRSNNKFFSMANDDTKAIFETFITILKNTKNFLDKRLDKLDVILISSDDFTTYGDEDKALVKNLCQIERMVIKATQSPLTYDTETVARDVRRAFGKLNAIIVSEYS